ncbi:MAG TPA: hypothetical protein VFZ56_11750 [Gemmatimonadaceae bacterium]
MSDAARPYPRVAWPLLMLGFLILGATGASAEGQSRGLHAIVSGTGIELLNAGSTADPIAELAAALVAGPTAVEKLRGLRVDAERHRLKLEISPMEICVVSQTEADVACYVDRRTEYAAHGTYDTLLVQIRGVLPADAWEEIQREPRNVWIRRSRFRHRESGARIDLDIGRMDGGAFRVWIFGFPASG